MVASLVLALAAASISPSQDANKAAFREPTVVIYQECKDLPPLVRGMIESLGGDASGCETLSKYTWVPSFTGLKAVVCMRTRNERLAQCFYRATDGEVTVIPILLYGEH